jgi:hypothetical protein
LIAKEIPMKTSIHSFAPLVLLWSVLAGCGQAQLQSPLSAGSSSAKARAEDLAAYIRAEHRRYVRISTGIYAHQCFTDDDLRAFRAAHSAERSALTAKRSPQFRRIVAAVAALPVEAQRSLLSNMERLSHPTWEELGRIATDGSGQTIAGAAAEREISAALVGAARAILAETDASGRK